MWRGLGTKRRTYQHSQIISYILIVTSRLDPMGREGRQVPLSLDEYQSKCKCVMYTGRNTQPFSFVSYVIVELKKIA